MLKSMRTRVGVKQGGKISTGIKVGNAGRGVDYFNIDDFPELIAAYGRKPQMLIVYPPSDNLQDFFDDQMCLWGGGKNAVKIRTCDGETCVHRIAEDVDGTPYAAGEETPCICEALPEDHKRRCRYLVNPKFYIGLPPNFAVDNLNCYLFETHSINSGEQLKSEMLKIKQITGRLAHIPFKLTVKMASGPTNASEKFPIWHLECAVTASAFKSDRILQEGFTVEALPGQAVPALPEGEKPPPASAPEPEPEDKGYTPDAITSALTRYEHEINTLEKEGCTRAQLSNFRERLVAFVDESKIGDDYRLDVIKETYSKINGILKKEEALRGQ
jgi:hypothetical protein